MLKKILIILVIHYIYFPTVIEDLFHIIETHCDGCIAKNTAKIRRKGILIFVRLNRKKLFILSRGLYSS